jgi:hypothetical protein
MILIMLNEQLVRALANGDAETLDRVNKLPVSMRMSYGLAVDELRRKENIVPMTNGLELYVQPNKAEADENAVGEAFKCILEDKKQKEAEAEKQRQENLEKRVRQETERARAGLRGF